MVVSEVDNWKTVIHTLFPGKDLTFQTIESFSGLYVADPIDVRILGFVASGVTGTLISTLFA